MAKKETVIETQETEDKKIPSIKVMKQYLRDLSFENVSAISKTDNKKNMSIELQVDVISDKLTGDDHESGIRLQATAKSEDTTVFIAELFYMGVFRLTNIPEDAVERVLYIEAPTVIFPAARNILADVTRDAGYTPVLVDPINFMALHQSKKNAQESQTPPAQQIES